MVLRNAITASSSAMSEQTAINLPATCGARAVTCRSAPRNGLHLSPPHGAITGWRKDKTPIPPIIGAADTRRRRYRKKVAEDTQDYNGKSVLFQTHQSRRVLRGGTPRQDSGTAAPSDTSDGIGMSHHNGTQGPCSLTPTRTADNRAKC
jgi:hypothetical protein